MTNDDELLQRQHLAILIYELGSHLNVYVHRLFIILFPCLRRILDHLHVFIPVLFICIDSLCYIHFNNV